MNSRPQDASGDESTRPDQDDSRGSTPGMLPTLLRASVPIALVTLAAGYVAYDYSARETATYQAFSQVVLSASTNFSPIDSSFDNSSPDRYVENQAQIMMTTDVTNRAAAALADGVPGEDLRGEISAGPAGASDVILIEAEAGDPALAARRADAVANAYAQFTAEQVRVLADQAVEVNAADPELVRQIRARASTFGDGVAVIQPASVPGEPASPTPSRNAYLAAVAAFLLATGLALSLRGYRRTVSPSRLAAATGGPLLGEVPVRSFGPLPVPRQPGAAEYGVAMQALRYRLRNAGDPSVLVTAVGRDSSATSALLGLAAADAAQGRSVVMVDATTDGRLLRRAGAPAPAISLTTALAGGEDLDRALGAVPALAGTPGSSVRIARVEQSARASTDALRKSLTALLGSADLILVDAGAVVHDAAAFALLGEVGGVVAVVRAKDRSDEPEELRRRLEQAGRDCDGVLVTRRTWVPSLDLLSTRSEPAAPPARLSSPETP
jgi:capsular polysaccharide biosynthesis protein